MKKTILVVLLAMMAALSAQAETYAFVRNTKIVVVQNGKEKVLAPNGADESYYFLSMSPDQKHLVYTTARHGAFVCDLKGNVVTSLGRLRALNWHGNNCVWGWNESTDFSVDIPSGNKRVLTAAESEELSQMERVRKAMDKEESLDLMDARQDLFKRQKGLKGLTIYINPGHGGYDNNDRSCWTIPVPETWSNPKGFWESSSNLKKALFLRDMLEAAGATVILSRTDNTSGIRDMSYYSGASASKRQAVSEGSDRELGQIAEEANANKVDYFISIHTNAGNAKVNYLLLLYHGENGAPSVASSDKMAETAAKILIENPLTVWTNKSPIVRGDISFYGNNSTGLGVLRPLTAPGFLLEGTFHDYPPETHRLMNDNYCKLEALRLYKHVCQYFNRTMPQTGTICGWVKSANERVDVLGKKKFTYLSGTDDQWLPINGARVVLKNEKGARVDSLVTDNWYNGVFAFYDLTPGTYQLEVTRAGYDTICSSVKVVAEDIVAAKIRLPKTPTLDELLQLQFDSFPTETIDIEAMMREDIILYLDEEDGKLQKKS